MNKFAATQNGKNSNGGEIIGFKKGWKDELNWARQSSACSRGIRFYNPGNKFKLLEKEIVRSSNFLRYFCRLTHAISVGCGGGKVLVWRYKLMICASPRRWCKWKVSMLGICRNCPSPWQSRLWSGRNRWSRRLSISPTLHICSRPPSGMHATAERRAARSAKSLSAPPSSRRRRLPRRRQGGRRRRWRSGLRRGSWKDWGDL